MRAQWIIGAILAIVGLNLAQETSICVGKPELSLHADPEDCRQFIICVSGVAHIIPCGDKYFDAESGVCVAGSTPSCPFYEAPPEGIECTAGPGETILIPYPNNCEKFLKCFDGRLKVFKCPEGLHWSDFRERCEWPSEARCVPQDQRPTVAPGECDPYEDPWNPTSFPHPTNCNLFYKCQGGQKLEVSCKDGHHYSAETKRCEYPAVAKCAPDLVTGTPNRCHINDDPYNPTQYAHSTDCTKFYKCDSDSRFVMNCPKGLHWNDVAKYCDYPESAKCLSAQSTLTNAEINLRTLRAAVFTPQVASAPICSADNDELRELPGFCSQYIQCLGGLVYVRSCQEGLFWNDIGKRCDYAVNSKCIGAVRSDVAPNCKDVVGSLAPNPSDCTKFYICSNGEAQIMDCPQGLHWSTAANRCEWPEIANCSVESESTVAPTEGVPTTEQSIDTTSGITTTSSGQEENTATTTPLVETETTTEEVITTIVDEGNDSNSTTEATIVTDPTIATTEDVAISTIVTEANNLTTAESTTTEITYTTTDIVTASTTEEPSSSSTQTEAPESTEAATEDTTSKYVTGQLTPATEVVTAQATTAITNEPTTPDDTIYTSITENTPITTTPENSVETSPNAPTGTQTDSGPLTPIIPTAFISFFNNLQQ